MSAPNTNSPGKLALLRIFLHKYLAVSNKSSKFAAENRNFIDMYSHLNTIEELRASVEEGTRQVEAGQYYTDAQVKQMDWWDIRRSPTTLKKGL